MKNENMIISKCIVLSIFLLSMTIIISCDYSEAVNPTEIGGNIDGTIPTTTETTPPTNTEIGGNIDGTIPTTTETTPPTNTEIGGNIDGTIPTTTETTPPTNTEIGGNIGRTIANIKNLQKKVINQIKPKKGSITLIIKLPVQLKNLSVTGIILKVQEKKLLH